MLCARCIGLLRSPVDGGLWVAANSKPSPHPFPHPFWLVIHVTGGKKLRPGFGGAQGDLFSKKRYFSVKDQQRQRNVSRRTSRGDAKFPLLLLLRVLCRFFREEKIQARHKLWAAWTTVAADDESQAAGHGRAAD